MALPLFFFKGKEVFCGRLEGKWTARAKFAGISTSTTLSAGSIGRLNGDVVYGVHIWGESRMDGGIGMEWGSLSFV